MGRDGFAAGTAGYEEVKFFLCPEVPSAFRGISLWDEFLEADTSIVSLARHLNSVNPECLRHSGAYRYAGEHSYANAKIEKRRLPCVRQYRY